MGPGSQANIIPYTLNNMKKSYTMNTGNMIFYYACENIIAMDNNKYGWGSHPNNINTNSMGIVLPLANQLGSHFDLNASGPKIIDIKIPIVALGLGVQFKLNGIDSSDIPSGSIEWLKELSSKTSTKNIAVRGKETEKLLTSLGFGESVEALGCPSLLINNSKSLGKQIFEKFNSFSKDDIVNNIAVAAGDPYINELTKLEQSLIEMINEFDGRYIVQNPALLLKLSSGWNSDISDAEMNMLQKRWFPNLNYKEISNWFLKKSDVYFSVPQWIYNHSRRNFVIGTRIHGVQAAIQAGTPAVCLYIDIRTKELCEMMKIPHAPASDFKNGITIDEALKIFDEWDYKEFDKNRIEIANKMKIFLLNNKIELNIDSILTKI